MGLVGIILVFKPEFVIDISRCRAGLMEEREEREEREELLLLLLFERVAIDFLESQKLHLLFSLLPYLTFQELLSFA